MKGVPGNLLLLKGCSPALKCPFIPMLCCCLPLTFDEMQDRHKYACQTDGNQNDIIHIYEPAGK